MANPAKDARDKVKAKYPDAVVSGRGHRFIEHTVPSISGKVVLDHEGPMHYGPALDQEIDTAWQPGTAPWDFEMIKAGYNAYTLENFSSGQIIKYVHPETGEDIGFQPQQLQYTNDLDQIQPIADPQSVIAAVDDDELYWTGAFGTDLDLKWEAQTARLDKRLIVQNASALPPVEQFIIDGGNPVLRLQFIFQHSPGVSLWVDSVEWDEKPSNPVETQGYIEFKNSAGDVLWVFNLPRSFSPSVDPEQQQLIGTFRLRKTGPRLFVEHLIPMDWLQSATYPVEIDVTVDEQVGTGADDGYYVTACTTYTNSSVTGLIGKFSGKVYQTWYRFQTVDVPNSPTIDVAYIELMGADPGGSGWLTKVYGNDVGDAAAPTDCTDANNKVRTTAGVDWDPATWVNGDWHSSPSIVSVIQEIVDRGDWAANNDMQILHDDDGTGNGNYIQTRHYEQATDEAPKLHIEYTAAAAGQPTQIRTQGVPTGAGSRDRIGRWN